jgi:hypothetical protein
LGLRHFSSNFWKKPFFSQHGSQQVSHDGVQVVQQLVLGAQQVVFWQEQSSQHFFGLPSHRR